MARFKKQKKRFYCDEPMARSKGYIRDSDDPNLIPCNKKIAKAAFAALRLMKMATENTSKQEGTDD